MKTQNVLVGLSSLCVALSVAQGARALARICNNTESYVLVTYLVPESEEICAFERAFNTELVPNDGACAVLNWDDSTGLELYYHVRSQSFEREWTGDSQVWLPDGPVNPLDEGIGFCMPDPACPDAPVETCTEGRVHPMIKWIPVASDETRYLDTLAPSDP